MRLTIIMPIVVVLLLGFGLRLNQIDEENYNWDEGYSNWIARLPFNDMLETTARDVHPPLYYTIVRATTAVTGNNEFTFRFPSVLFNLITLAFTFASCRSARFEYKTGFIAVLLLVFARAHIEISQLARMHALAIMFNMGAIWATTRFFMKQKADKFTALMYIFCSAGALYSFYLTAMLLLVTNFAFLYIWSRWKYPLKPLLMWGVLQIAVVLIIVPWLYYALPLITPINAETALNLGFLIQSYLATLVVGVSVNLQTYIPQILIIATLTIGGTGYLTYRSRQSPTQNGVLMLFNLTFIIPFIVIAFLTTPGHKFGRPLAIRYFLLMSPGFYVLAALVYTEWKRLTLLLSGFAVIVLVAVLPKYYAERLYHDTFDTVANTLYTYRQPNDVLVLHNDIVWTTWDSAYPNQQWERVRSGHQVNDRFIADFIAPLWQQSEALWVLETPDALVNDPHRQLDGWLKEQSITTRSWTFNKSILSVYVRTQERLASLYDTTHPVTDDLVNVYIPHDVYPIGDHVYVSLYWSKPPEYSIEINITGDSFQQMFTFDPPIPSQNGATHQIIDIPLTPDLPEGKFELHYKNYYLGTFKLVNPINPIKSIHDLDSSVIPLNWQFGENIELLGYKHSASSVEPGDDIRVNLYWRTNAVLEERYKVLVYVIGEFNPATNNPLWGQQDTEPLNWTLPTTQWPPNTIIEDDYSFKLANNTPLGDYGLGIVVYTLVSGERLSITDQDEGFLGDTAILTSLTVK